MRVRATQEAVVGAAVRINNTHTLNPKPPVAAEGVTDDTGTVVLEVGLYNDLVIRVTPPDGPEHVYSSEHPAFVGPSPWLRPVRTAGAGAPTIEIRMSPTAPVAADSLQPEPAGAPNQ